MNTKILSEWLEKEAGQHITTIYIPSIKEDMSFKPLTTADVKTLARVGLYNDFDINNELLKLTMFDKLMIDDPGKAKVNSDTIKQIDFFSFLIGIRQLINSELVYNFECKKCKHRFRHSIDLNATFEKNIFNYEAKTLMFEKIDSADHVWKFELESYTMKNYLFYRYYLDRLRDVDAANPDVMNSGKFLRPVLYIKNIWKDDELIDDWGEQLIATKIKIMNALPQEILFNTSRTTSNLSLIEFIDKNFDEEQMFKDVAKYEVECDNCHEKYIAGFKYDDFFSC